MNSLTKISQRSLRTIYSTFNILSISLALITTGVVLFTFESYQQRDALAGRLTAQARLVGETATAALAFDDPDAATRALDALHSDSRIVEAAMFDGQGKPFSRWHGGTSDRQLLSSGHSGVFFADQTVEAIQPILFEGRQIGLILLKSRNDVADRLRRYTGIICIVLFGSLGLSFLVSTRLQQTIIKPIEELSAAARTVAESRRYDVRAGATRDHSGDPAELGFLIGSFNEMLAQIEAQERFRKLAAESLRESEERYALAARGANDGLWDWKLTTNEVYFSPRWYEMIGLAPSDASTDISEWLELIHPMDRQRVLREIESHKAGESVEFSSEYRVRHANGTYLWVLSRGQAVRDDMGTALRMAGSHTDITEGKIADPLTGLPNRLYFLDRLEAAIDSAMNCGSACAVLFLDLDQFKLVNDSLGHAAGDALLMEVSARLRSAVRAPARNSGGKESIIARLGGDEFAILLPDGGADTSTAATVATRILNRLASPFRMNGRQIFASMSIGISVWTGSENAEDLLRNADTAMYHAKTRGKARFEIFDQQMRERAIARLETETGLRKAIAQEELCLHYQPEINLRTRRVVGYEALVRWNHPTRGLLAPAEFIPLAEESELIVVLGKWVLREACRQMSIWNGKFANHPPLTISVNVSPKQLAARDFVDDVAAVLTSCNLKPQQLILEVTESCLITNPAGVIDTLLKLKEMSVGLEIDDFGTGYSSLSYLQNLPFDTVKIDRSFIKNLCCGAEKTEMVQTIVALARCLEMEVVAEGVESQRQMESLESLGCGYAQGFYFAKPLSAELTEQMLEQMMTSPASLAAAIARPKIVEPILEEVVA